MCNNERLCVCVCVCASTAGGSVLHEGGLPLCGDALEQHGDGHGNILQHWAVGVWCITLESERAGFLLAEVNLKSITKQKKNY